MMEVVQPWIILCFLLLPVYTAAIATPVKRAVKTSTTRSVPTELLIPTAPSPQAPSHFIPWSKPVVTANGDYRDEAYLEDVIGGPLYSKQKELPRLPVPSLDTTISSFVPTALPLASDESEAQSLLQACNDFPNQAQALQERLVQRKENEFSDSSWLQHLWNSQGYLQCRDPVAVLVSYFLFVPDDAFLPDDNKGVTRAAAILTAMAISRKNICSGNMAVETISHRGTEEPMCSSFFKYMFHSCRIPQKDQDCYHVYDPSRYHHCIVACRGRFFAVDFCDPSGDPLPLDTLQARLQRCVDLASSSNDDVPSLGWLTSTNRTFWANARQELLHVGGSTMQDALAKMESGAFVLNLDDDEPASLTEAARTFWHGGDASGGNRWFDKTMQLACTKNGKLAYIGEHSMLDAAPAISVISRILKTTYKRLRKKQPENVVSPQDASTGVLDVFEECWSSSPIRETAERLVSDAREHHKKLTGDYDIQVLEYKDFGKNFLKKNGFICHDFAQMAMQLASYRLFGEQVATYEAALTRNFLHGRTETTRLVSPESQAFVECMGLEPSSNVCDRSKKLDLLRQAASVHDEYQRKASQGLGVDRHFFGLSCMLKNDEEPPTLFSHPLFHQSKRWRLTTSSVTYAPGFGPVVDDGIGIGYRVQPNSFIFTCTSRQENNYLDRFCHLLDEALTEMGDLVKEESESS